MAPGLGSTHELPAMWVEVPLTLLPHCQPQSRPMWEQHPPTQGRWHQAGSHSRTHDRQGRARTHGRHFSCRGPWVGKSLHLPLGLSLAIRTDDHIRAPCRDIPQLTSKAQALVPGLRPEGGGRGSMLCPAARVGSRELGPGSPLTLVWAYSQAPSLPSSPSLRPAWGAPVWPRRLPRPRPPADCLSSSRFFQREAPSASQRHQPGPVQPAREEVHSLRGDTAQPAAT